MTLPPFPERFAKPRPKPPCATEGCGKPSVIQFIRGDIGSHYCRECYGKISMEDLE